MPCDRVLEAAVEVVGDDLAGHVLVIVRASSELRGGDGGGLVGQGELFSGRMGIGRRRRRRTGGHTRPLRGYQAPPEQADVRADATTSSSACSRSGGRARVLARVAPTRCARPSRPLRAASRRSSRGREAGRPEVGLGVAAGLVLDDRALVGDARARRRTSSCSGQVADLEVGRERGERRPRRRAAGPGRCRRGRRRRGRAPRDRRGRSAPPAGQPERALAERDGGVELARRRAGPGRRAARRSRPAGASARARSTNRCRCRRRGPRSPAGRARGRGGPARSPTSSTRMPGLEPERVDEEARPPARCPS